MLWIESVNALDLAVRGMAVGIVASAPMGPVGVLTVQRTFNKGRWYGFATGCGAAVSDLIYAVATGFGMSLVMDFIERPTTVFYLKILGSILLFMVAWPWTMKFTGIVPGGKREMLSIPFQMTARYVKEHPDDITEEESEVIDKMLYMETLAERYDPVSADPVKGFAFYEIHNTPDYLDYIRVWFRQGCRHPGSYVNAFFERFPV